MKKQLKSCFVIASVLLMLVPVSANNVDSTESSGLLTSDSMDGLWVNNTLEISGSTNLNPQNADWVLYDVTNPYSNGQYFAVEISSPLLLQLMKASGIGH